MNLRASSIKAVLALRCGKKLKTSKHVRAVFLNVGGPEIE
jgi:hypothetical protein